MQNVTIDDINRVRSSFDRVLGSAKPFASVFYDRLFEAVPSVRPMFKGDIAEQQKKFMGTLAVVVGSLENPDILLPAATSLARNHVDYGVTPDHYPVVGEVLLWSLEHCLNREWTPAVAESWTKAYGALSDHMIATAYR